MPKHKTKIGLSRKNNQFEALLVCPSQTLEQSEQRACWFLYSGQQQTVACLCIRRLTAEELNENAASSDPRQVLNNKWLVEGTERRKVEYGETFLHQGLYSEAPICGSLYKIKDFSLIETYDYEVGLPTLTSIGHIEPISSKETFKSAPSAKKSSSKSDCHHRSSSRPSSQKNLKKRNSSSGKSSSRSKKSKSGSKEANAKSSSRSKQHKSGSKVANTETPSKQPKSHRRKKSQKPLK